MQNSTRGNEGRTTAVASVHDAYRQKGGVTLKTIRADSFPVEIYNSGLLVFLYDESHSETIRSAYPSVLDYYDEGSVYDDALIKLTQDGILVVYELAQDDELMVEVSLGPPLSAAEKGTLPWTRDQHARIGIPSGKLCIEGYDALRLGEEEPTDEGAVLKVPPAEYQLTLHRLDILSMPEETAEEWEGPFEVIALSGLTDDSAAVDSPPILLYPQDDE